MILGIDGSAIVHAAGSRWDEVALAVLDPSTRMSRRESHAGDVDGFYVPPSPQPNIPNGRRFSPWLKMALSAGQSALGNGTDQAQGCKLGIIGATTMGSLQHTAAFAENMLRNHEAAPQPANFILSVHNAATAQLAIALHATGFNATVCYDETAFEQALILAAGRVRRDSDARLIVVGAEEWIPLLHTARLDAGCAVDLPGEGAAALAVGQPRPGQIGVRAMDWRFFNHEEMDQAMALWLQAGLDNAGISWEAIDLIMSVDDHTALWDRIPLARLIPRMTCWPWLGRFESANALVICSAAAWLNPAVDKPAGLPEDLQTVLVVNQAPSGSASWVVVGR